MHTAIPPATSVASFVYLKKEKKENCVQIPILIRGTVPLLMSM